MAFGSAQAAQLKRLLSRYGASDNATIRRETAGTFDPVSGESTGGVPSLIDLFCAKLPIKKSMLVDERIRASDSRLICNNDVQPLEADTIVMDGIDYQVIIITKHKNASTIIGYEVICRA